MNKLEEILERKLCNRRVLFCCMGNPLRGDDVFGIIVAEKIKKLINNDNILVLNCEATPELYTGKIIEFDPEVIIFIDTIFFEGKPGDIIIAEGEETAGTITSNHNLPIKVLINYIKKIINTETIIIGIQPSHLLLGEKPSRKTIERAIQLSKIIINIINKCSMQEEGLKGRNFAVP